MINERNSRDEAKITFIAKIIQETNEIAGERFNATCKMHKLRGLTLS
jgi:hypothetical protein